MIILYRETDCSGPLIRVFASLPGGHMGPCPVRALSPSNLCYSLTVNVIIEVLLIKSSPFMKWLINRCFHTRGRI